MTLTAWCLNLRKVLLTQIISMLHMLMQVKTIPTLAFTLVPIIAELGAAQGVHCDPGTHGGHHAGLLANGLAGKSLLYCDGYQDF